GPSRIVAVFVGPEYGVVVHREPGEIGSPDVVEELPIAPTTNVMLIRFGVLVELVLLQVATRRRSRGLASIPAGILAKYLPWCGTAATVPGTSGTGARKARSTLDMSGACRSGGATAARLCTRRGRRRRDCFLAQPVWN